MEEKIVYDLEYAKEYIEVGTGEVKTLGQITFDDYLRRMQQEEMLSGNKRQLTEKQVEYLRSVKNKNLFYEALAFYCGGYVFNKFDYILDNIDNNMAFRYIYLCTFMNYDNVLIYGKAKNKMNFKDFQEVFKLSERECRNVKNTFLDFNLISVDKEGNITVNSKYCKRGEMPKSFERGCLRMFDKAIQELYNNSNAREHQTIGMLIKLFPYVNRANNVICHNIDETNPALVKPLKQKEILEILNASKTSLKTLSNLKIMNGTEGAFIKTSNPFIRNFFVINPRFTYYGSELEDLEKTLSLFKIGSGV